MNKYLISLFLVYLLSCVLTQPVQGQVMSNDGYAIEKRDIKIDNFKLQPTPTTTPQIEKPFASGENYSVQTTNASAFSFSTSHDEVDFGKLTATNPVIRLLYLTISSSKAYQIGAYENHPLSDGAKSIPDSTCDNGSCTEKTAAEWSSSLTYGFGYQLKTMPETNYKHFPDWSQNEAFEVIASGSKAENAQTQITYKVNIPSTQQAGHYKNVVTYIASPAF